MIKTINTLLTFIISSAILYSSGTRAEQLISSYVFADVVKSSGNGSIDLYKPKSSDRIISGTLLEAFRQDNNGKLVFAVDVNEASSGSEFADSQGVAIQEAVLTISFDDSDVQFTSFSTQTSSILAETGSSQRSEYFTLIGTTGSNRVSPNMDSEINNSSMDGTLHFDIDADLSNATAAVLTIKFLTTNQSLGDPESFYDFSNGYEEVALLTREDALYLDQLAPGRNLAPLVITDEPVYNWVYYPSSQNYFVVAYEDLYPVKGDYDFNDLVVAYQVGFGLDDWGNVAMIRGNGYLLARGAAYDHDWRLRIELPEWATGSVSHSLYPVDSYSPYDGFPKTADLQGSLDLPLVEHIAAIYADGESTYVNTFDYQTLKKGPKFDFQVQLDNAIPPTDIATAPFDPYLYIHDTNYEVHLVDKSPTLPYSTNTITGLTSFRDDTGFPFAIVVPDEWHPPAAGIDMGLAYPTFTNYVNSNAIENTNWFTKPAENKIKQIPASFWKW